MFCRLGFRAKPQKSAVSQTDLKCGKTDYLFLYSVQSLWGFLQLLQETAESHAWKRIPCPTNWSPGSKWDFTTGILAVNWEGKYPRPSSTQACFLSYDSHSKCRKTQVEESQGMCPERNHACDISSTLSLLPNVCNIVGLTGALFFLSGLIFDNY